MFHYLPSVQRYCHYFRANNVRWKTRVKAAVAPVVMIERNLKKAAGPESILRIYDEEKVNFTSVHWSTVIERLFNTSPKRLKHFRLNYDPPALIRCRNQVDSFLNDLADTMESQGVKYFGANQTVTMVSHLISNSALEKSPAVARIVSVVSQSFEAFVEKGNPKDIAVLLSAMAKTNLRKPFYSAIDYLQADTSRARWALSGRANDTIFSSLLLMETKAPEFNRLIVSDPGRVIAPDLTVAQIAKFLPDYVALGYRDREVFEALTQNHHWIVNKGSATMLADIAHAIATAEMMDCSLFFEAMENRAEWFGQQGTTEDFAKMTWAASVIFPLHGLPQLFQSIDDEGMAILRKCADSGDQAHNDIARAKLEDLATIIRSFAVLKHKCPCIRDAVEVYADKIPGETLVDIQKSLAAIRNSESPSE